MQNWNVKELLDTFVECAAIARKIKETPTVEVKDDLTPVTNADRGIELFLTGKFGFDSILGEETCQDHDHDRLMNSLLHDKMWIVDPIDGTANFINRRPIWGISIGYAENGVIREGGVYTPELGEIMFSDNGKTWFASLRRSYPTRREMEEAVRPIKNPNRPFNGTSCINLSQLMTRKGIFTGVNPVISIGSCVCSGIDLAAGRDAVYITSAKLWDLAGILPCLKNLSFVSRNRSGRDLLSCRISSVLYQLENGAEKPFALREPNWIGASLNAVETIIPLCSL